MASQSHAEWRHAAAELKSQLEASPNDLELAQRYWSLISGETGFDARSGQALVQTFRSCALNSDAGLEQLVMAFRKLADDTGEYPRAELIDPPLYNALRTVAGQPGHALFDAAAWILSFVHED